ncbi:hypothetical protein BKA70DRAFT_1088124 [Coprinopsis sp. MPI-PUGE-AT-0042]|nr:hypothetical protein BKA70DRAFT_1088124 [Coprinopsis sp. MPI-PUGE-AT-0042]
MSKLFKSSLSLSTHGSPTKTIVNPTSKGLSDPDASTRMEPLTAREQYWATRALKAEALLEAKELHHREVKSISFSQDMKRSRDLTLLLQQHEAKQASLEKVLLVLGAVIAVLVLIIIYLSIHHARHASKVQRSSWLTGLPNHFTIPILSPFTSVVEQETSVLGTKAIAIIVIVSGAVIFLAFRQWLSSRELRRA